MEIEQAVELLDGLKTIEDTEEIDIEDGLKRVLGEDIYSPIDLPLFDRSPIDGYAVRSKDTGKGSRLKLIDRIEAGSVSKKELGEKEAIRIMTGAKLPKGADCVAWLEKAREDGDYIVLENSYQPYENYIFKGEELKKGSKVFSKGEELNAIKLGTLANLGIARIRVLRMPKIALISTGSELVDYKGELTNGKIFNSNSITLGQRLKELGFEVDRLDQLDDDPARLKEVFSSMDEDYDLVISTGGVSVGDADYMPEVLKDIGCKLIFRDISMKPGSHLLAAQGKRAVYFALSGNPFAALATFEIFTRYALARLSARKIYLRKKRGTCTNSFPKKSRKRRIIRAYYEDGRVKFPKDHESGKLGSAAYCNSLVDIKAGSGKLEPGDEVDVWLL